MSVDNKTEHQHAVKAALTGFVSVPVEDDVPSLDGKSLEIELQDVPILDIETRPVDGLTLHYGRTDIPTVLAAQFAEAKKDHMNLYEVKVMVNVGRAGIKPFLQSDDIAETRILTLPRVSNDAARYLSELIKSEIDAISGVSESLIDPTKLHLLISKYPHLIDALASTQELRHIAVFVWSASTPNVSSTKLATIYKPEDVTEVRTLNADYVRAVLPHHLRASPSERLSAQQTVGYFRRPSGPGM